jgi:hypothetical protein
MVYDLKGQGTRVRFWARTRYFSFLQTCSEAHQALIQLILGDLSQSLKGREHEANHLFPASAIEYVELCYHSPIHLRCALLNELCTVTGRHQAKLCCLSASCLIFAWLTLQPWRRRWHAPRKRRSIACFMLDSCSAHSSVLKMEATCSS